MHLKRSFIVATAGAIVALVANAHEPKVEPGKEKCYGVAKAGKNECASKLGKHGCAGYSKEDGSTVDFIQVPQGLCEKLNGGSLEERQNN